MTSSRFKTWRRPVAAAVIALLSIPAGAGGGVGIGYVPPPDETALYWTPNGGGTWFNAYAWMPYRNEVPGDDDIAVLTGGSPVLDTDTTVMGYYQWSSDGPSNLGGSGVLHTGEFRWGSGTQSGSGGAIVHGEASLGYGDGFATQTLSGGRFLTLAGATTFQSNTLNLSDGSTVTNAGTFTSIGERRGTGFYDNQILAFAGTGNRFRNDGHFVQDAGGHTTNVTVAFDNAGTLQVTSGTLKLAGGGSHSGSFAVLAGQTLSFGGDHDLHSGQLLNDGLLRFGSGHSRIASTTGYGGGGQLFVDNGTLDIAVSAGLQVAHLKMNSGRLQLDPGLGATLSAGLFEMHNSATLQGTATLEAGTLVWTTGRMTGPGVARVTGSAQLGDGQGYGSQTLDGGRTLALQGETRFQSAFIGLGGASLIDNQGTFTSAGDRRGAAVYDSSITDYNANGRFRNRGRFVQDASGHVTNVYAAFDNAGEVDVRSGTLKLLGGGTQTGTFQVRAGQALELGGSHGFSAAQVDNAGTLQVNGGATTLGADTTLAGTGHLRVHGGRLAITQAQALTPGSVTLQAGTFAAGSAVQTASYVQLNGTLEGAGNLEAGQLHWQTGTMRGSGTTRVTGSATLGDGVGYANAVLAGRTLELAGHTLLQAAAVTMSEGAVLRNLGSLHNRGDVRGATVTGNALAHVNIGAASVIDNRGLWVQDSGATATMVGMRFDNRGTLRVDSGQLVFNGGLQLLGDASVLDLAITGVHNTAIDVNALAALDGTLNLRFDGFAVQAGDLIGVFDYATFNGTFDRVRAIGLDDGLRLTALYGAQGLSVQVSAVPEPGTWAMLVAGMGFIALRRRRPRA